jgi:hypothetical protein
MKDSEKSSANIGLNLAEARGMIGQLMIVLSRRWGLFTMRWSCRSSKILAKMSQDGIDGCVRGFSLAKSNEKLG